MSFTFIAGIIVGFLLVILSAFIFGLLYQHYATSDTNGWQIGDMVLVDTHKEQLRKHNVKFATLRGWDKSSGYVSIGDDVYKIGLNQISMNKSAVWRANFNSCKEVMGVEPNFTAVIHNEQNPEKNKNNKTGSSNSQINGMDISTMNEIECEVYLKLAIKEQMYEQAELIKKRMEKFR